MIIDARHCGPPGSGNGGWVAGALVAHVGGSGSVRLSAPPPLDRELAVDVTGDGSSAELRDGELVVAVAQAGDGPVVDVPAPVTLEQAREASEGFDHASHPFPGCYVCGSDRPDGLREWTAPVAGRGDHLVASPVVLPDADTATVWAALDCPGAFSIGMGDGVPLLLGTMSARVGDRPVPVGEELVVMGWALGAERRKRRCATALLDADGTVLAAAEALWIAPRP